jgi:uncharacterized protein (TIGR03437 family)
MRIRFAAFLTIFSLAAEPSSGQGIITTVAGGASGYSGDGGPATKAGFDTFGSASGLAIDAADVTPSILPGVIVEQSTALTNPVTISFGTTPATLSYSGLAGNFVGLYEFYITVPASLANGDYQINVSQKRDQSAPNDLPKRTQLSPALEPFSKRHPDVDADGVRASYSVRSDCQRTARLP